MRVPSLGGESFWLDEYFTATAVDGSFGDVLDSLRETEGSPPLYYATAWSWAQALGTSEVALRSFSWLVGVAAVPVIAWAAHALADSRAAVWAAALAAFNPMLAWYAAEARAYALFALLSAATFVCFARELRGRARDREFLLWAVIATLAVWTHYFAAFLVAAQALVLLRRPSGRRYAAALAAVVAACAPLALLVRGQASRTQWIEALQLGHRLAQVPRDFVVGVSNPDNGLAAVALLAAFVAVAAGIRAASPERLHLVAALAAVIGAAAVAPIVLALLGLDFVLARNYIGVLVGVVIGVGVLGSASVVARAAMLGVLAASFVAVVWVATDDTLQKPDWRSVGTSLGSPTERRLVLAWGDLALPLFLYVKGSTGVDPAQPISVGEVVVVGFHGPGFAANCWWGATCSIPAAAPGAAPPLAGLVLIERRSRALFDVARFVARPPISTTAAELIDAYPELPEPFVVTQGAGAG